MVKKIEFEKPILVSDDDDAPEELDNEDLAKMNKKRKSPLCDNDGIKVKNYGFLIGFIILIIAIILGFTALPIILGFNVPEGYLTIDYYRNLIIFIILLTISIITMVYNDQIAKSICKTK